MKKKKWFIKPTSEELAQQRAHDINKKLLSDFSIEEQTLIIEKVIEYMSSHRDQEIIDAEEHLSRLIENSNKLKGLKIDKTLKINRA